MWCSGVSGCDTIDTDSIYGYWNGREICAVHTGFQFVTLLDDIAGYDIIPAADKINNQSPKFNLFIKSFSFLCKSHELTK